MLRLFCTYVLLAGTGTGVILLIEGYEGEEKFYITLQAINQRNQEA
ncbi:MAG: hypothetical protein M3Y81_10765 [Chloroflexota bacterium]|nr:hypothetical protein [Chloroflexota bacterium]